MTSYNGNDVEFSVLGRIYYKCICFGPNLHLVCLGPLPCIVPLLDYLLLPCFSR